MIKTLKTLFKHRTRSDLLYQSVQSVIPIKTIWEDGIFLVGKNKYAKTFKFEDINTLWQAVRTRKRCSLNTQSF